MDTPTTFPADKAWADQVWAKITAKMPYAIEKAKENSFMPYTVTNGNWAPGNGGDIRWWTNGFWPATMWRMHLVTGDPQYKAEAERAETMLDACWDFSEGLHHDVGFLWLLSSGVNYRLTDNAQSRERTVKAANFLMSRFNPTGSFLRAWNGDRSGWAIIDCMMNIPLLYWASDVFSDPRYKQIAMLHADMTLAQFIRPDGSVHHIVAFDPTTGEVVDHPYGQGYATGSSWSRGQAWAMYGFTLSYLHTGEARYLDAAKRVSHYFIANIQQDWIPACDFRAPKEPVVKDNAAGSIAACALMELAKIVPEYEKDSYLAPALNILAAADAHCADWTHASPAILQMCTGSYHADDHHIAMTYADYFFIEAMHKLRDPQAMQFF